MLFNTTQYIRHEVNKMRPEGELLVALLSGGWKDMKDPKTASVKLTKDELELVQFLIRHREEIKGYRAFAQKRETHVGIKVSDALVKLDINQTS